MECWWFFYVIGVQERRSGEGNFSQNTKFDSFVTPIQYFDVLVSQIEI